MKLEKRIQLVDVNAENVSETGFFCYMSKRKTEGYRRKLSWVKERFTEGMRIKMFKLPLRGFIEYIPGEYAWRAVDAKGYMFIHCLWVVGQSRGKGLASLLLRECIRDAKKSGMSGVAMVTSERDWLVKKQFLSKQGFESVDQAPPTFALLVKKFDDYPSPTFSGGWKSKIKRYGKGITVFRSDQCPYIENYVIAVKKKAKELGITCQVVELNSDQDVRNLAPSAYGVFGITYNGNILSYNNLVKNELPK
ncbi:MAG TPA: GNAT family N-acetyltransferase [candidate division Zixibacteria bacterium]